MTEQGRFISLFQLFIYLLRRWRSFVAVVLIGAALGLGVSFLPKPEPTLDEVDMDNVEMQRIAQYVSYQELYDKQVEYEEASPIQRLVPGKAYSGRVTYYIASAASEAELLSMQLTDLLNRDEVLSELVDAYGEGIDVIHLKEMVSSSYVVKSNAETAIVAMGEGGSASTGYTGTVIFQVIADRAEACRSILDILMRHTDALRARQEQTYPGTAMTLVNNVVQEMSAASVISRKTDLIENRDHYFTQLELLRKSMNADEALYYDIVHAKDDGEEPLLISKRNIVLGALILALILMIVYCARFVLNDQLHTVSDVRRLGLYPLANVRMSKAPRRGPDAWIDRMARGAYNAANDREYLLQALAGADTQVICADLSDAQVKELLDWCCEQRPGLTVYGLQQQDPAALEAVRKSGRAALALRLDQARFINVRREIEIAANAGAKIDGVITVS